MCPSFQIGSIYLFSEVIQETQLRQLYSFVSKSEVPHMMKRLGPLNSGSTSDVNFEIFSSAIILSYNPGVGTKRGGKMHAYVSRKSSMYISRYERCFGVSLNTTFCTI